MATTAVYVRVSTDDQKLDSQLDEVKRYCALRCWGNLDFYADKLSGVKVRPEFERMMFEVQRGLIERVVCYKLDRIGRSLSQLASTVETLTFYKVPLVCTSQGIDTSDNNPAGKFQLQVLMAVAEFERGIIQERVNAGIMAAKQRGVRFGRPETLRARADEIVSLRKQGHSMHTIATMLAMPYSSVQKVCSQNPGPTA